MKTVSVCFVSEPVNNSAYLPGSSGGGEGRVVAGGAELKLIPVVSLGLSAPPPPSLYSVHTMGTLTTQ